MPAFEIDITLDSPRRESADAGVTDRTVLRRTSATRL
jgi:hypothetical protein